MLIDPTKTEPRAFYGHMVGAITPRPIAWVSTVSPAGVTNLAPFSFFNGVGANPPSVMFAPVNNRKGEEKDTLRNVRATGQFVVNIVSRALAERMNQTSFEYGYEVSEFERAGLTAAASERVTPPRVAEAPLAMECELTQIVPVGEGPLAGHVVIGRVLLMHVADGVLDPSGAIDPAKLDTVGRMGSATYTTTRDRFDMPRPAAPAPDHGTPTGATP